VHGRAAAAHCVQTFGLWGCMMVLHPTSSRYAPVRVLRARLDDILTKKMACPTARLANGLAMHKISGTLWAFSQCRASKNPLPPLRPLLPLTRQLHGCSRAGGAGDASRGCSRSQPQHPCLTREPGRQLLSGCRQLSTFLLRAAGLSRKAVYAHCDCPAADVSIVHRLHR
jgi:hypothetical protein